MKLYLILLFICCVSWGVDVKDFHFKYIKEMAPMLGDAPIPAPTPINGRPYFHLFLWTVVGLTTSILLVSYYLCVMEVYEDPLVYLVGTVMDESESLFEDGL
jgi:hypothetical protein